jgi:hypothetical protein
MIIGLLPPREVPWRSGDAPDCKSVYPGSIPGGTSIFLLHCDDHRLRAASRKMPCLRHCLAVWTIGRRPIGPVGFEPRS